MKVVILAGGYGTRISEESHLKPKPMIEIGGKPIMWHIMKTYSHFGFNEFIICLGYKGHIVKEFFSDYYLRNSDVTFDFSNHNSVTIHNNVSEPWIVTLVDTGLDTMTGGRIKRVEKYLGKQTFLLTYGDGVSDVDICKLTTHHERSGNLLTITAVRPGGRFGALEIDHATDRVSRFEEKSNEEGGWINGGFMVLEPTVLNYIQGDATVFERDVVEELADRGLLGAYKHYGFWKCMDTQRDKTVLDNLWERGNAPWKLWD
jgi:glucose-1-phosphate cytidylyltransferase